MVESFLQTLLHCTSVPGKPCQNCRKEDALFNSPTLGIPQGKMWGAMNGLSSALSNVFRTSRSTVRILPLLFMAEEVEEPGRVCGTCSAAGGSRSYREQELSYIIKDLDSLPSSATIFLKHDLQLKPLYLSLPQLFIYRDESENILRKFVKCSYYCIVGRSFS